MGHKVTQVGVTKRHGPDNMARLSAHVAVSVRWCRAKTVIWLCGTRIAFKYIGMAPKINNTSRISKINPIHVPL